MNLLDGAFVALCVAGLVGALWLFDIALDTNKHERMNYVNDDVLLSEQIRKIIMTDGEVMTDGECLDAVLELLDTRLENVFSARDRAIASALGENVILVSIRKGSALPYRVEHLENVYGFTEASSMLRFIVLIGHGLYDEEVMQAVRACEGVSVLHPVFR